MEERRRKKRKGTVSAWRLGLSCTQRKVCSVPLSQKEGCEFPEKNLGPHSKNIRKFCTLIAKERGRR